jgi:hypothetical protein
MCYNNRQVGEEIGRIWAETSQSKKLVRPHLNKKLGVVVHACHPSYVGGVSRRIAVQASPGKKHETLSEKQLKQKGLGMWLKW